MANRKHVDLLRQGVKVWNRWREKHPDMIPDLAGADLSGAELDNANLWRADLSGVNLSEALLYEVNLSGASLYKTSLGYAKLGRATLNGAMLDEANLYAADLSKANLSGAKLNVADLSKVDLSKASLIRAWLNEANLSEANLSGANLGGATLSGAKLYKADLSATDLELATLNETDLGETTLSGTNLRKARLVETNFTKAILTNCNVYGISAWNVKLGGAIQHNLVITPNGEPVISVDDLEVAQCIYLLLNHQKLRNVLNAVTERGVLLLGRFGGGGLEVLQAVAARLREAKYLPIIFDFERPRDRSYTETVKTLAGLSRFIIADLSGPSVPQELYATIPHYKIPFVPILEAGRKQFAMVADLLEYPWVVRPHQSSSPAPMSWSASCH